MANLVARSNGQYIPNGDWKLYKYYANMVGDRLATTASTNPQFDGFVVKEKSMLKVIAGARSLQRDSAISITGLESLGFPSSGSISIRSYRFDWKGAQGQVGDPVNMGSSMHTYGSGSASSSTLNPHSSQVTLLTVQAQRTVQPTD